MGEADDKEKPVKEPDLFKDTRYYGNFGDGCYKVSLANWKGVSGGVSRRFPCKLYGKDGALENAKAWHAFIVEESVLLKSYSVHQLKDGNRASLGGCPFL